MKKFNLFKEIITTNKQELLQAINSTKLFAINVSGEVIYEPFADKEILIFSTKHTPKPTSALTPSKPESLSDIFGKNYQLVEDDDRVLIKAFSNWQALIALNMPRASYDDTTGDGVDKFANPELEDMGWKITDFNVTYRTLVEHLEEVCEGTLLCIEQEEPYQFSGLGFFADDEDTKKTFFNYCQAEVKRVMQEDPLYVKDNLDDDEEEAARFFKCL